MRKKSLLKGMIPLLAGMLFSFGLLAQEGRLPVIGEQANGEKSSKTLIKSQATKVIQPVAGKSAASGGADKLVNNNNGGTAVGQFTQSETSLVAWGNNVVIGFNDAGSLASGSHFTGWSYSSDGGANFTDGGFLPASAIGDAGDPLLARNSTTGRIYFVTLGFSGAGTLQMFRSDDNGVSWLAPVNCTPGGTTEDKPWMAVDNYAGPGNGTVYVMSRRFAAAQGLYLFKSTDNGATFGPAGGTLIASGAAGNVQGAYLVVAPDHSITAFYFDDVANDIKVRKSTDLGATFSAPVVVVGGLPAAVNGNLGLTGIRQGSAAVVAHRSNCFPHAAVHPTNSNLLYMVYNNDGAGADRADVFVIQSTDGGATWGAPVMVNDDATTTDQWMPTIAVMDDGSSLGIFYYSRQEDAANNLYKFYGRIGVIAGSTVTFQPSFAVSDVASLPEVGRDNVVNTVYMGDYDQAIGLAGTYHVIWADNRDDYVAGPPRKDPNVYYDKVVAAVVQPEISVNPTSLVINLPYGGSGSTTFDITNTVADAIDLTWVATEACTWITSIAPAAGSIAGGASTTVTVNVDATGLNCGTYNCDITITSNASNTPILTLPVQLNVLSTLSCSIVSVPSNNVYTGGNPNNIFLGYGPQSTTLQSTVSGGAGPFTYSWSPTTGLNNPNSAAPVFTPTAAGTYVFTLTVTGPGGCTTTCTITINVYDVRVPGTNGKKVYLCHVPPDNPANAHTLAISINAVNAHLTGHPGDHLGTCDLVIAPRNVIADDLVAAIKKAVLTFPNPNKGSFSLQLDNYKTGRVEIRIVNADGVLVERKMVNVTGNGQTIHFNLKSQAGGLYYVQVVGTDGTQSSKFVINR